MLFYRIRWSAAGWALLVQLCGACAILFAHPASGIVADARGNVYYIDSRHAVMKLDASGALTVVLSVPDGHWLALDEAGYFSQSTPKYFQRITPNGAKPTLIFAGGGAPLAVAQDGALYYGSGESNGDPMFPGALALSKILPDGRQMPVPGQLPEMLRRWDDGVTGIAAGFDRSVYVATWTGVLKVSLDGSVTVVKHPIDVPGCDVDFADHRQGNKRPFLRGITVLRDGAVYAAATSCHALLKISLHGDVRNVLKSERPWSPTGVAEHDGDLYILEYTNANGPATEGWQSRVRKIDGHGKVSIVAGVRQLKRCRVKMHYSFRIRVCQTEWG